MDTALTITRDATRRRLSLPMNVSPEERAHREAQLTRFRRIYRYHKTDGLPGWTAGGLGGAPPMRELAPGWIWQLLKTGARLARTKQRMSMSSMLGRFSSEGRKAGSIELFTRLFFEKKTRLPPDHVARLWRSDEEFGYQRLNGLCPWFLEKVGALPSNFPCTDATVDGLLPTGTTLESLRAAGRLFITNHAYLEGASKENARYLCAPICLFWVTDEGKLLPLAIQLNQSPSENPIFTPKDPPGLWLAVKIWANCCDLHVHDMFVHTATFHFVMEPVWLAANRCLADAHPLKEFLRPHFAVTIAIGAGVRMTISQGGPLAEIHSFGGKGTWDFIRKMYANWSFEELNIERHFARRGVTDVPNFYFRDDSLRYWRAISRYTRDIVDVYYANDAQLGEDAELQAWFTEMSDPACCGLKGLPLSSNGRMETRADLAEFLARVVFTTGPKHSFIRNSGIQYDYFVPNMPAMFHLPPPTTKDDISEAQISAALPPNKLGIQQMALMESIDQPAQEFNRLGDYPSDYMAGGDGAAQAVVQAWQEELRVIEAEINERNKGLADRPYESLLPSQSFNSIWN